MLGDTGALYLPLLQSEHDPNRNLRKVPCQGLGVGYY
jgi:hypothetical protein